MTDFYELTDVEQAAMEVWGRGSADSTQALLAVRAAVSEMERRQNMSEDHRVVFLEGTLAEIRDIVLCDASNPDQALRATLETIYRRAEGALKEATQ